ELRLIGLEASPTEHKGVTVPTFEQIFDFQPGDVYEYSTSDFVTRKLPEYHSQHHIYDVQRTQDSFVVFYDNMWRRDVIDYDIDPVTGREDFTKPNIVSTTTGIDSGKVQVYRRKDYPWVGAYPSQMAPPYLVATKGKDYPDFEDKIPEQLWGNHSYYRYSSL